jgi:hypothetical protein
MALLLVNILAANSQTAAVLDKTLEINYFTPIVFQDPFIKTNKGCTIKSNSKDLAYICLQQNFTAFAL